MKINLKNGSQIDAALHAINGRSESFCYTTADEIRALAIRADKTLADRGACKKHASGSILNACPAGPSAKSYKYRANATRVTLTRSAGGWYLTGVSMGTVYPRTRELFALTVPASAAADIVSHAMSGISIANA
tara:strand:+ start:448 stop:846 length:399 start_codon:yes stop_codon:yes gene_type:complete